MGLIGHLDLSWSWNTFHANLFEFKLSLNGYEEHSVVLKSVNSATICHKVLNYIRSKKDLFFKKEIVNFSINLLQIIDNFFLLSFSQLWMREKCTARNLNSGFFQKKNSAHCELMAPMEFVCMTLKILTDFLCGRFPTWRKLISDLEGISIYIYYKRRE